MKPTAMPASDILSLLARMIDFLDNQSDAEVIDGKAIPNEAMRIMGDCEEAFTKIDGYGVANDI